MLIKHGSGILQDSQWLEKVEIIKRNLALFRKRWTLAGELQLRGVLKRHHRGKLTNHQIIIWAPSILH
jgi:hypothetical protein